MSAGGMTLNRSWHTASLAVTSFVLAAILVVVVGIPAAGPGVLPGDVPVARAIQRLHGQPWEALATVGNAVGSTAGGLVILAAVMILAALWRAGKDLVFLAALLVLRLLATQAKPLFDSPRPTADLVTIHGTFDGTGFPSGHATTAMALALGLSIIAWRWARHRPVAIAVTGGLLLMALVVGWARVWSGAHWPSDVLGGYGVGAMIAALAVLIRDRQPWVER